MLTTKPVSSLTKVLVSVALVTAATTPAYAGAAACQAGQPGCVLPVAEPAPPPPPAEAPPPVAVVEEEAKGIGVWPIILGIAALAGLAFLLLDDDDDEDEVSP